jgi:hypothetical protein
LHWIRVDGKVSIIVLLLQIYVLIAYDIKCL